jgi:hypothetical protein
MVGLQTLDLAIGVRVPASQNLKGLEIAPALMLLAEMLFISGHRQRKN